MLKSLLSAGSRRRFLQAAAAAGASVGFNPGIAAAGVSREPGSAAAGRAEAASRHARLDAAGPGWQRIEHHDIVAAARRAVALVAHGVDDVFPRPFEVDRLVNDARLRERIVERVAATIAQGADETTPPSSIHLMAVPKNSYGMRRAAHMETIGAVQYLTCAILAAGHLEPARQPAERNQVFSHRFNAGDGPLFDPAYGYGTFEAFILERLDEQSRSVVVRADIAEFYPNIDIRQMSSALLGCGVPQRIVDSLGALLMRWSGPSGRGLPIGNDASRLLAEAMLLAVDRKLDRDDIAYARFCDDFCIFAQSAAEAQRALARLTEHLAAEGFSLNQGKTAIESVNRPEYAAILATQRSRRFWGRRTLENLKLAETAPAPKPDPTPDTKGKKKNSSSKKGPLPSTYASSPFDAPLPSADDLELFRMVDRHGLAAQLAQNASAKGNVSLGELRLLAEASMHAGDYSQLAAVLDLVEQCPQGVVYLANVLINRGEALPAGIVARVVRWAGDRLLASPVAANQYELLHLARLLALDPQGAEAAYRFLLASAHACSAIVARSALAALEGHIDDGRATVLAGLCANVDGFVRRAIVASIWTQLDARERAILTSRYGDEFALDPFLADVARCDPQPAEA